MKVVMACVATVAIGGGAAVAMPHLLGIPTSEAAGSSSEAEGLRSVRVERTSLAQGSVISGTLSRGEPAPVNASREGVLTWVPTPGDVVGPGGRLLEVNGRPTFMLHGSVPLWRPLQLGDRGKDVKSLNDALAEAGLLDPASADEVFGQGASAALARLFESAGYAPPSRTDEGIERIHQAEAALESAKRGLNDARSALEDADKAASALELAEADAAVEETQRALADAQATGQGVSLAQARLDAALAERARLLATPDLSVHQQAVRDAEESVVDAQEDLRTARAERVDPADVVILDVAELRVASTSGTVGAAASGEVLGWTGSMVRVEAQVTRSQQAALTVGDQVSVTLPTSEEITGKIVSTAGTGTDDEAAADGASGSGEGEGGSSDLVTLVVEPDAQDRVADLVGSVVRIEVTSASVEDALVVPVTALLALAEGGYAVEKVTPGSPPGSGELVPVEVGLVADARVQVTSAHLHEGDEVLVP